MVVPMGALNGPRPPRDFTRPLLAYGTLTSSLLLVLVSWNTPVPHAGIVPILIIFVLTAGWIAWWIDLHPQWQHRRGLMGIFLTGFLVLGLAAAWASPLFGIFTWTGYIFAGYAMPVHTAAVWQMAVVAPVAAINAFAQVGGWVTFSGDYGVAIYLAVLLCNLLIAETMTVISIRAARKSQSREDQIDTLAEANARLAAALQENAGLHAQLLVQAHEAGVLNERQRMAGEIHDVLAQGLTGIVTQLEAAESHPVQRDRHLQTAKRLARESLTEARRSVQALRPQQLDAAQLPDAIDDVVRGWSAQHGVRADLTVTGAARPMLPEIETTLLRTAQEALANVAKHAGAARVGLTLSYMEDLVTLDVRDDGAGFDPDLPREVTEHGGFGLAGMRERLARVAGTLVVESEPGAGTAISACVPAILIGGTA